MVNLTGVGIMFLFFGWVGYTVVFTANPRDLFAVACIAKNKDAKVIHTRREGSFCVKPDGFIVID